MSGTHEERFRRVATNIINMCTVVDKALEVTDEYHMKIDQFERQILLRPKMETVKECKLHIHF